MFFYICFYIGKLKYKNVCVCLILIKFSLLSYSLPYPVLVIFEHENEYFSGEKHSPGVYYIQIFNYNFNPLYCIHNSQMVKLFCEMSNYLDTQNKFEIIHIRNE